MARSGAFFSRWITRNIWFGHVTCENGEISGLRVAPASRTGQGVSAYKCGFGSVLSYLCFQNIEHEPLGRENAPVRGYNLDNDPRFTQGNMGEIRNGLVNRHCKRVVYLKYLDPLGDPQLRRGNKAFIYAARAAHFNHLIAYNPDPCRRQCCTIVDAKGIPRGFQGKIFRIADMLNEFNRHQPSWMTGQNLPKGNRVHHEPDLTDTRLFAEHNGRDWYFCRMSFE